VSWSSGKDSAWMVHVLRSRQIEIGELLTTVNEAVGRVAMHAVRLELVQAQAAALALPLRTVPIPSPCSNEAYERAMGEAVRQEVHGSGIRVTLIEPGITDTPFFDQRPEHALADSDIARAVLYALSQPPEVSVNEILVRPTAQQA